MKNSEEPIYPVQEKVYHEVLGHDLPSEVTHLGLSKREYFAGLAMQGFISGRKDPLHIISEKTLMLYAKIAIDQADALLKQLEK